MTRTFTIYALPSILVCEFLLLAKLIFYKILFRNYYLCLGVLP